MPIAPSATWGAMRSGATGPEALARLARGVIVAVTVTSSSCIGSSNHRHGASGIHLNDL
jgi:hypothetical protein